MAINKNSTVQDYIDPETIESDSLSSEEVYVETQIYHPSSLSSQYVQGPKQNWLHLNPAIVSSQPIEIQNEVLKKDITETIEQSPQQRVIGSKNLNLTHRNIKQEQVLLKKFEDEVLNHELSSKTFRALRTETQEKYMYQIRRYIFHCANKGLDNFYVNYEVVKELIEHEIQKRGQITENTIKSLRSSLNKLYHMNRIVYSTAQPHIILGDNIVQEIMSNYKEQSQRELNKGSGEGSGSSSSTPLNSRSTNLKELSDSSGKPTTISSASTSTSLLETKEQVDYEKEEKDLDQFPAISTDGNEGLFKLSTTSKIKLTPEEEYLLKKFNQEVLRSERTADILSSLTVNTFKSYATDMKRYIRFCARQGRTNTFVDDGILRKFLTSEVNITKKSNSKKLRTSLLKLHQLNCQAYNLDYSEGNIVFLINKHVDGSNSEFADEPVIPIKEFNSTNLLVILEEMLKTTKLLSGLTKANKILHENEFKRYASFCSNNKLDHFHVKGETLVEYFEELTKSDSNINPKKLKRFLKKLTLLHMLNEENFENYPTIIENVQLVEEFIANFKATSGVTHPISSSTDLSSSGDGTGASTYSGVSSSISSLAANVPPLFLNEQSAAGDGTSSSLPSEQSVQSTSVNPIPTEQPKPKTTGAVISSAIVPNFEQAGPSSRVITTEKDDSGIGQDNSDEHQSHQKNSDDPNEIDDNVDLDASSSGSVSDDEVDDSGSKDEDSSDMSVYTSKRQKLESLPPTSDIIPPFVMNSNIRTVIQLVEEWSLIIKRVLKWGLGWIKTQEDYKLYNDRKVIIDFIEDILPELDIQNSGKAINEVDEDKVYDIAKVFDQYITRREITLNDLIQKIDNNPVYSKKEFLRILTRRQVTDA